MDEPSHHLSKKERRELRRSGQLPPLNDNSKRHLRRWLTWSGAVFGLGLVIWGLAYLAKSDANPGNDNNQVAAVTESDHVRGDRNAPAVLIEYSDFQCPACGSYEPVLQQLSEIFDDKLAVVYRHFPLTSIHQNAEDAALASEAADAQGAFWAYHDLLFDRQTSWSTNPDPTKTFTDYAGELGLNTDQFKTDMRGAAARDKVAADIASGNRANLNSTPTFFLNGKKIQNPRGLDAFKQLIEDAIANRSTNQNTNASAEQVHLHADFRMVVDGQAWDFTPAKYQATKDNELNPRIHFHDGRGDLFHVHAAEQKLNDLFTSFGMELNPRCLKLDNGQEKCGQAPKLYVNGQVNNQFGDYVPKDLDRIVIVAGDYTSEELQAQVEQVTDQACIYSEQCPERGTPPTEECIGGLGTDCTT